VNKRRGFTLIEMMIVILVIAVLATIVAMAIRNASERSKQSTLKAHLKAINDALTLARQDWDIAHATPPVYTLEQLASEDPPPGVTNWQGPYLTEIPQHPYGGTYVYDANQGKYVSAPSS